MLINNGDVRDNVEREVIPSTQSILFPSSRQRFEGIDEGILEYGGHRKRRIFYDKRAGVSSLLSALILLPTQSDVLPSKM
jgi:hypothetical protein